MSCRLVTINVPSNQGPPLQSGHGVLFADINISRWSAQIKILETQADPTHLPIYLTDSVLLQIGKDVLNCCVIGYHGFDQGPNPNGTQSADGYYHPEDEVFLPRFMRTAPNNVSEPTQSPSTNVGRHTLMGDLNPFPGFRQPATGC